jgi:hypothetical protein
VEDRRLFIYLFIYDSSGYAICTLKHMTPNDGTTGKVVQGSAGGLI